jgi:GMP synthase (glutamine-hydrolysing)
MILIISTCKEPLSELEFVEPIKRMVDKFFVKRFDKITDDDLKKSDKVIICGTALKDFDYLSANWSWIESFEKPLLGICAGAQVIGKAYGLHLKDETHIGQQKVETLKQNKLCDGEFNAYFLHTKNVEGLETVATSQGKPCILKHPKKEHYAVIFHPEVMSKHIIVNFLQKT